MKWFIKFYKIKSSNLVHIFRFPLEFQEIKSQLLSLYNSVYFSVGRYCGTNPPAKVNAQGTSLYIKLVSDESDTGPGFAASWTSKHLGGNTGRELSEYVTKTFFLMVVAPTLPNYAGQTIFSKQIDQPKWRVYFRPYYKIVMRYMFSSLIPFFNPNS